MNNTEFLQKRWQNIDKLLDGYIRYSKKRNNEKNNALELILTSFYISGNKLYQNASKSRINAFKSEIERIVKKYDKNDYFKYKCRQFLNRKRITNADIIEFSIYIEYMKEKQDLEKYQEEMFIKVSEEAYSQVAKETKKDIKPKRDYLLELLLLPNAMGYIWYKYMNSITEYNASELYRQVLVDIQRDKKPSIFDKIYQVIQKRQRERIAKKNINKYSGTLEAQITSIYNQELVKAYKDAEVMQVEFVAMMDERTTKMCRSLNGQKFYIDKVNIYTRYSEANGSEIEFKTKGLKLGYNLPAINDHFHWCRSTIRGVKNERV